MTLNTALDNTAPKNTPLDSPELDDDAALDGPAPAKAPVSGPWLLNVTSAPWLPWFCVSLMLSALSAVAAWMTLPAGPFDLGHIAWSLVAALLPILFLVDTAIQRLPDGIVLPALQVVGGLYLIDAVMGGLSWGAYLTGALCALGGYMVYFTIAVITRGMGLGDVKFAALLGFTIGAIYGPLGVLYAILIVPGLLGIFPILYLIIRKRTEAAVPFGPYMAIGAALVMFGLVG